MKTNTKATEYPRITAVLIASAIALASASSFAADTSEEAYDNVTVTEQVSAYGAKRLGRQFLVERGFTTGKGPGKAAIKSVTREGDTWILQVAISDSGWISNRKAVLYIDAASAMVSEVAPAPKPEQVAAQ